MTSLKYDLVALMRMGADALHAQGDDAGRFYALHEASNNLLLCLRGDATLEELRAVYSGGQNQIENTDEKYPGDDG